MLPFDTPTRPLDADREGFRGARPQLRCAGILGPRRLSFRTLALWIQVRADPQAALRALPRFVIDHFGGIVVSGYASFGDDCRIRIGDRVCIGANAVVITDVPADCIAMGVPAVIRRKRSAV